MKTSESKSSNKSSDGSPSVLHPKEQLFFKPVAIQPLLKIGRRGDKYEQQADRVAGAVVSDGGPKIQRQAMEEEEELQMKSDASAQSYGAGYANGETSSRIKSSTGNGTPLPNQVQSEMGQKMGVDFSEVNIHTDSEAAQLNQALEARAFAHGSDIYFNEGEYNPGSKSGKRLLAHELTHVVQQTQTDNAIQRQSEGSYQQIGGIWTFDPGEQGGPTFSGHSKTHARKLAVEAGVIGPAQKETEKANGFSKIVKQKDEIYKLYLGDFKKGKYVLSSVHTNAIGELKTRINNYVKKYNDKVEFIKENNIFRKELFKLDWRKMVLGIYGMVSPEGSEGYDNVALAHERALEVNDELSSKGFIVPGDKIDYMSDNDIKQQGDLPKAQYPYHRAAFIYFYEPNMPVRKKNTPKETRFEFILKTKKYLEEKKTEYSEVLLCTLDEMLELVVKDGKVIKIKFKQFQGDYFTYETMKKLDQDISKILSKHAKPPSGWGWKMAPDIDKEAAANELKKLNPSDYYIDFKYMFKHTSAESVEQYVSQMTTYLKDANDGIRYLNRHLDMQLSCPSALSFGGIAGRIITKRLSRPNDIYSCLLPLKVEEGCFK